MESREIREKFISFFEKKGHKIIPSSSLLPQDDPTTLFTGSGMQPLLPYFLGKKHPLGSRLVNSQKSFRAEDIEEVGDNRHTTFFEMLGNWSLGDYFKVEQIRWLFEFLIEEIKLDPKKLYVTVFSGDGDHNIPRDAESAAIWARLFEERGIEPKEVDLITEENGGELGMGEGRIFYYGVKKNWWSRKGAPIAMPAGEPGGPDSEVFYDFGREHNPEYGRNCHPNCGCGRFIEIGNSVFMEYVKEEEGSFKSLPQKNVDFGGGLERITAAANDNKNIFEIDTLRPLISEIKKLSEKGEGDKSIQIVADHLRSVAFLIADGALPSNIGQGYVARRLIRRAIRHSDVLGMGEGKLSNLAKIVAETYKDVYPEVYERMIAVEDGINQEEARFRHTLQNGLKEFKKMSVSGRVTGKEAFKLFSTYGFPIEMTMELAMEEKVQLDRGGFDEEFREHQEISRAGKEKKFGGHGLILDTGELKAGSGEELKQVTRLHTATHLLNAALHNVLGEEVSQRGSDITPERTRLDFTFPRKLTTDELKEVEDIVNKAIAVDCSVTFREMPLEEAKKSGALFFYKGDYPEIVKIYSIGKGKETFSKELCGGPHVSSTSEIGRFHIIKEEASSSGIRRIRAVLT